jgi:hypothetical protein
VDDGATRSRDVGGLSRPPTVWDVTSTSRLDSIGSSSAMHRDSRNAPSHASSCWIEGGVIVTGGEAVWDVCFLISPPVIFNFQGVDS